MGCDWGRRVHIQVSALPFCCSDQGPNFEMRLVIGGISELSTSGGPKCANGTYSKHTAIAVGLRLPVQHQSRDHHQNKQNTEESTDDIADMKSFP